MSQYWDNFATNWSAPVAPQTQVPQLDFSQGGLRSWEMQQPLLNEGAGGFAVPGISPGATPAGGGFGGFGDWLKNSGMMNYQTEGPNGAVLQQQGWGMPALGAAQGLLSAFMGMKQYGLAKDSLAESKRQFGLNFDAQKTTTNSQLEDRQRARVASNAGAYQSVGDYMSQNAIKG